MKILIVEDSATLRQAMESQVRELNHETVLAENGETAVQIIDRMSIDMVIMDIELSGLDGFETTRLIRESLAGRWIPIIFVSAKTDEQSLSRAIAVGADDYLYKPLSKIVLQAKISAMERIANMQKQMQSMNDKLTQLSQYDGLTRLLNRRTFEQRADQAWRSAVREKKPISVMLLDIDFFKHYNDHYGHLIGDECIQRVAESAATCFQRPGDMLARFGGEEFIALLQNTDRQGAMHIAEQVRTKIQELAIPHDKSPDYGVVTVSVGVCATQQAVGSTIQRVVQAADKALYQSKNDGRNKVRRCSVNDARSLAVVGEKISEYRGLKQELGPHYDLRVARVPEHIEQLPKDFSPELLVVCADSEDDPDAKLTKALIEQKNLQRSAVLVVSPQQEASFATLLPGRTVLRYPNRDNPDFTLAATIVAHFKHIL